MTQEERRGSRRTQVPQPVRMQPKEAKDGYFDEITTTLDTSKHAVSFATRLAVYYIGMELRVTYPHTATIKVNHIGKVIRVEPLDENFLRIVVKLT